MSEEGRHPEIYLKALAIVREYERGKAAAEARGSRRLGEGLTDEVTLAQAVVQFYNQLLVANGPAPRPDAAQQGARDTLDALAHDYAPSRTVVSLADIYDCDCNSSPHLKTCAIHKNRPTSTTDARG